MTAPKKPTTAGRRAAGSRAVGKAAASAEPAQGVGLIAGSDRERVAAVFSQSPYAQSLPVWLAAGGAGRTMIDAQKGRRNYHRMTRREQGALCRRAAGTNWFLRPVLGLRQAATVAGFRATAGVNEDYRDWLADLVDDMVDEDLHTSNVVCLWRKGGDGVPRVEVLDMAQVDYRSCGGVERITISVSKDPVLRSKEAYEMARAALGDKMAKACLQGGSATILKGHDDEWDFEVSMDGKNRGALVVPEVVSVLDPLDYMELMGVGDWNLGWARKDVIRMIKKGYKVTQGQGAGVNSVDIKEPEIEELGTAWSGINGNVTIPANHDVDPSYLLVDSGVFDPKQVKSAIERLMVFGGLEAVTLFDSFSQQNGVAPSLLRNARERGIARRARMERLLRRVLAADEFQDVVDAPRAEFAWSMRPFYSVTDLMELVRGTADGVASPQTRREMLDLDDTRESERMREAHARREDYTPPFEARQGMAAGGGGEPGSEGGRPMSNPEV